MRTEAIPALGVVAAGVLILSVRSLSGPLVTAFDVLAYGAVTLLLWIATRGARPLAVPAAVIALGACAQDPLLATVVASATAATLFFLQGKPVCAESSPR